MTPEEIERTIHGLTESGTEASIHASRPPTDMETTTVVGIGITSALYEIAYQLAVANAPKLRTEQIRGEQHVARETRKLIAAFPCQNAEQQHVVLSIIEAIDKAGLGGGQ